MHQDGDHAGYILESHLFEVAPSTRAQKFLRFEPRGVLLLRLGTMCDLGDFRGILPHGKPS